MKKLLMFAFAVMFLAACTSPQEGPENVAEKFLNHLGKLEFTEAKELGTEETKELLSLLEGFAGMAGDEVLDTPAVTDVNCAESEDTADCTYCCDEDGNQASVKMKKVDGNWLVHMSKEDAFGDTGLDDWDEEDFDLDEEEEYDAEY